ncbi:MAG: hypothetical protein CL912_12980 [Deltaproteobacteria bacterium]|nr:hypothetical protein [Deltaproteobacteria bacterium]
MDLYPLINTSVEHRSPCSSVDSHSQRIRIRLDVIGVLKSQKITLVWEWRILAEIGSVTGKLFSFLYFFGGARDWGIEKTENDAKIKDH